MVPTCRVQPLSAHTQSHFSPTHNSTALPGLAGPGRQKRAALGLTAHFLFPWSIQRSRDTPGMGMAAPCRGSVLLGLDSRIPENTQGLSGFYQSTALPFPCSFIREKHDSCRAIPAGPSEPHGLLCPTSGCCPALQAVLNLGAQCPPCQARAGPEPADPQPQRQGMRSRTGKKRRKHEGEAVHEGGDGGE